MRRLLASLAVTSALVLGATGCGTPPGAPQAPTGATTAVEALVEGCEAHEGVQSHSISTGHGVDSATAICKDGSVVEVEPD